MHHGRHVEAHHLFVNWIPVAVGQRRVCPIATCRIRIQVAANKPETLDAPPKFRNAIGRRNTGRLRELTDSHKIVWKERADPVDQIVADFSPGQTRLLVPQMVSHLAGDWRKQGEIAAAFYLEFQLPTYDGDPDFVVCNYEISFLRRFQRIVNRFQLSLAPCMKSLWRCCEMSVTVNNHWLPPAFICYLSPTSFRDRRTAHRWTCAEA